jgi:ABC-type hemin transport system substrate-binding protein
VLEYAGLADVAASRWDGWPRYTAEDVLALSPDVIVTKRHSRRALCERPGLARTTACATGAVIAVDGELLDAPGPLLLRAAEEVHDAARGLGLFERRPAEH